MRGDQRQRLAAGHEDRRRLVVDADQVVGDRLGHRRADLEEDGVRELLLQAEIAQPAAG